MGSAAAHCLPLGPHGRASAARSARSRALARRHAALTAAAGVGAVAAPAQPPALRLRTLWRCAGEAAAAVPARGPLAGAHPLLRLLLASDGSLTLHLATLTGRPTRVAVDRLDALPLPGEAEEAEAEDGDEGGAAFSPAELLGGPPRPLLRRTARVGLLPTASGGLADGSETALVHAVSWWGAEGYAASLGADPSRPIGDALAASRSELRRTLCSVSLVEEATSGGVLRAAFGGENPAGVRVSRPCWCRRYVLHSAGRPLAVVQEVFSPRAAATLVAASGGAAAWGG